MLKYHQWENFHTHCCESASYDPKAIASYSLSESREIVPDAWYTIGLHPWDSERLDAYRLVENHLPDFLSQPRCLAVGEVGIDRLRGADLKVQEELFARQVMLAERFNLPLVVHCVRAWSEVIAIVRSIGFTGCKAIHGFRGKSHILNHLLSDDWYISVGPNKIGQLPETLYEIPSDRLLLETDDASYSIDYVFNIAAEMLDTSVDMIRRQVIQNIQHFVGRRIPLD